MARHAGTGLYQPPTCFGRPPAARHPVPPMLIGVSHRGNLLRRARPPRATKPLSLRGGIGGTHRAGAPVLVGPARRPCAGGCRAGGGLLGAKGPASRLLIRDGRTRDPPYSFS